MLDARPRYVSGANSLWDAAAHRRDALANHVRYILAEQRVHAELDISQPGIYPPSLTLRCWLPTGQAFADPLDTRMRSSLDIAVDVKPFHTYKFAHQVKLEKAGRKYGLWLQPAKVALFNENDVHAWVLYALGRGSRPYSRTALILNFLAGLVPFIGFRNKVLPSYRNQWLSPQRLGTTGLFGSSLLVGIPQPVTVAIGALGMLVSAAVLYLNRSKGLLVSTPPTPTLTPRTLNAWGWWDIVLPSLGTEYDSVRSRILRAVGDNRPEHIEVLEEVASRWTANGLEQRDRVVYKNRQCEVHLHIYQLGPDLYVGWNAFINEGQWGESATSTSRRQIGSQTIEFREAMPSVYTPTDFDWIDLRGLAEFVQRRLEQIIRVLLKEQNIDIELDFRIERSGIDSHAGKAAAKTSENPGVFSLKRSKAGRS